MGLLGGVISNLSGDLSNQVENKIGQFATKVATETIGNASVDLGCLKLSIF